MGNPFPKPAFARDSRWDAWPRTAFVGAMFIVSYLLLDWISYVYPMPEFNVTPWNPHPALAVALLMVGGRRWLPAVAAATIAAALFGRGAPASVPVNLLIATLLTLGYFAIAQALAHAYPVARKLGSRRDMLRLITVVTAGSLIIGICYTAILRMTGLGPAEHYFAAILRFWIGNSVGILVTLPLLLMLLDPERRAQMKHMLRRAETHAQLAAIGVILWIVFQQTALEDFTRFYLLFLPLIWIATRSGMVGTALATVIIQVGMIVAVQLQEYQTLTVFELQARLVALTITGFFLGVTVEEQQRAAHELRGSLKLAAAGEMAAALAHELNQPLTALTSYAKASQLLAESGEQGRPQMVETLKKLVSEATRAADVVRRLRDFFSTGATRLQEASLPQLAAGVIESLRARASAVGVELELCSPKPVPNVLIDSLQIEVVIRNLIVNAIEAVVDTADGAKTVSVEVHANDANSIQLVVTDPGPGITLERMEHLFEPFSTTKATGMGMGLAISRAIIEGHGGRLWARSGNCGIVGFTLPMKESADG